MSLDPRALQRPDLEMDRAAALAWLERGQVGRLGTTDSAGWPYVVPLLYVMDGGTVLMHRAQRQGHLSSNLADNGRACFTVDEPGAAYGYGRFECDSALSYVSVMVFGCTTAVEDRQAKTLFCEKLMAKYGSGMSGRPPGFFPRLDHIAVFALPIERITGKQIALPVEAARWPVLDRTRSPGASPPGVAAPPAAPLPPGL